MTKEEKLKLVADSLLDLAKDAGSIALEDFRDEDAMNDRIEVSMSRCLRSILPLLDLDEKPSRREMIATTLMANRRANQDFMYSSEQTAKWSVQDADALLKKLAEGEVSNG